MNIGEAAQLSGVPAKTIRYYEEIGLIPPARRSEAGYRRFGGRDLSTLRFVQRARSLGFTVRDVSALLALWHDTGRASSEVKALAGEHCARIDAKIAELQSMRRTLDDLMTRCHGDAHPDCPILDELAGKG